MYRNMGYETRFTPAGQLLLGSVPDHKAAKWASDPLNSDADAFALLHWCAAKPREWYWHLHKWKTCVTLVILDEDDDLCRVDLDGADPATVRLVICKAVAQAVASYTATVEGG